MTINGGRLAAFGANRNISEDYTVNADFTIGNADNRDLTMSGDGLLTDDIAITVEDGVSGSLTSNVTGNFDVTKEGTGTLRLTQNNSFDDFTVNAGTAFSDAQTDIAVGGTGTGRNVFGDGDVTVNSGGTLAIDTDDNIEIGDGSELRNSGGTIDFAADDNLTFDGDFVQTAGSATFDIGGDIVTDPDSELTVSGGTVDFIGGGNFTTANSGSELTISNGAAVDVDLSGGAGGSSFTIGQNDELVVDGAATTLTVASDANGTVNLNGEIRLSNNGTMTVSQGNTIFGSNSEFNGGSAATAGTLVVQDDLTFTAGMDIANAPNVTLDIANGDSTVITAAAANTNIENLGIITKTGDGSTTIGTNLNNLQATQIVINGGTLLNGTDNQIENNVGMTFADNVGGSTTPTWNVNDSSEVLGTLTLNNDSQVNLDLGSDSADGSIVQFADSSNISWTGTGDIIIDNWNGDLDGGGLDQIFFGNSADGLEAGQLNRILFRNPGGVGSGFFQARILPTGEIVPVPEPGTYAAGLALVGGLLVFEIRRRRRKAKSSAV